MSRNYMSKYDELYKGDYLWPSNKEYKAVFQEDGNYVIYGWKQVWSSDTYSMRDDHRLCTQDDCNFIRLGRGNQALWHTHTHQTVCHLYLHNVGTMVIKRDGEEIWSSATSRGQK